MGAVFSQVAGAFVVAGEKVGLITDRMEKARRDKMWRKNPQLRKLVPKSRCPRCRRRLEPKCVDSASASSEDEMQATVAALPCPPKRHDAMRKEEAPQECQEPVKKTTVVTFVEEFEEAKESEKSGDQRLAAFGGVEGPDELNFNVGLQKDLDGRGCPSKMAFLENSTKPPQTTTNVIPI